MIPSNMSFADFMHYRDALVHNVAWRAYDIPSAVKLYHTKQALKALGFRKNTHGETRLQITSCAAQYGLNPEKAPELLGQWWLLSQIEKGRRVRVPLRAPGTAKGGLGLPP